MPPPPLSPSYVLLPLCLHEILIIFHVNQERKTNIFRIILSHNQTLKKKKKEFSLEIYSMKNIFPKNIISVQTN